MKMIEETYKRSFMESKENCFSKLWKSKTIETETITARGKSMKRRAQVQENLRMENEGRETTNKPKRMVFLEARSQSMKVFRADIFTKIKENFSSASEFEYFRKKNLKIKFSLRKIGGI